MIRVIAILFFVAFAWVAKGQEFDNGFHIGWNSMVPFADKDFTGSTSTSGIRAGYSKFLSERFGFGFEVGYSILDDYVPLTTYMTDNGAVTTDRYNYLYYLTIMANGQYYFHHGRHFIPYTSLGMGIAINQYKIFYNVYQDSNRNNGFVIRPEIGSIIKVKQNGNFGFKAALGLDYATNANDYFGTSNLAALNIQLGIVLLNY